MDYSSFSFFSLIFVSPSSLFFYLPSLSSSPFLIISLQDIERTREVYTECLKLVPHKIFSFSKLWVMFGNFEIRQKDMAAARKVFGNAIGMTPKAKIFQAYIQLEWQLGSIFSTIIFSSVSPVLRTSPPLSSLPQPSLTSPHPSLTAPSPLFPLPLLPPNFF